MTTFITLFILLFIAVIFFITYPFVRGKIVTKKYDSFCARKVRKIAEKNKLKFITKIKMLDYQKEDLKINSILFGKKYIYIISNYCFEGEISGVLDDGSWKLTNHRGIGSYIDNISIELSRKTMEFSQKVIINPEFVISIGLLNNECILSIENVNKPNQFIVHYSSLKKLIKNLERRDIQILDEEMVEKEYQNIRNFYGEK